jgi:hypothetical protein
MKQSHVAFDSPGRTLLTTNFTLYLLTWSCCHVAKGNKYIWLVATNQILRMFAAQFEKDASNAEAQLVRDRAANGEWGYQQW